MSAADLLLALKQSAANKVAAIDAEKTDAQGVVDQLAGLDSAIQTETSESNKAQYEQGFQDGQAQAGTSGDKVFTNEEYNQGVADAVAPLNAQIASLNDQAAASAVSIKSLQDQVATLQGMIGSSQAVVEAVAAVKLQISQQIKDVQVDNDALADKLAAEGTIAEPTPVDPAPVDPAPVDPAPVDPAPADPSAPNLRRRK